MRTLTQKQYLNMGLDFDIGEQRNTASMDMRPESPADYAEVGDMSVGKEGMALIPTFTDERFIQVVNYPIIVECWRRKDSGRGRREWLKSFTQAERNKLGRYYAKFHRWHLVTGTPHRVALRLDTINLLQRAVIWFVNI